MIRKIKVFLAYFFIFCLFTAVFFNSSALAAAPERESILIKFKNGRIKTETAIHGRAQERLDFYNSLDEVSFAELEKKYKISLIPNDTYYSEQWYLEKIEADKAWDEVKSASDITIAIVDSGVDIDHFDLIDNRWINKDEIPKNGIDDDKNGFIDDIYGWDFVENVPDPSPKFREGFTEEGVTHGTIVAGIAAASGNNGTGIAGVAWDAEIMALKALDDKGEGRTSNVVKAIDYAINNKADIINFSFVGFDYSRALHEAVERAHKAGIVMVAAAGNEQDDGSGYKLDDIPMYPACHDGDNNMVVGVAATDTLDQKASFSSYGFSCVDIAAPGMSIFSTVTYEPGRRLANKIFNKYYDGYWSGTSMATPMVSGAIALIEGANREMNAKEVKQTLFSSADNISRLNPDYLGQLGMGRLNVYKAVSSAKNELNDFESSLITAPASGKKGLLRIRNSQKTVESEFLSYQPGFTGGVELSSADIDGDGNDEIITGAGYGGGPHVRIFNKKGELIGQFFAYDENFRGGVNVAAGDIDGDGNDEIITGAGYGGGPHVRVFDGSGGVKEQFFAYNESFRGGVNVAAGDIDGDGLSEVMTGAGKNGSPHVRVFRTNGQLLSSFYAYEQDFNGGVNVVVAKNKK